MKQYIVNFTESHAAVINADRVKIEKGRLIFFNVWQIRRECVAVFSLDEIVGFCEM